MSAGSLDRLEPAVRTLGHLAQAFGFLPVTDVDVRDVCRGGERRAVVVISVHDGLTDFEAWREALDIPTEAVTLALLPRAASLWAETEWGGTWIEVHGYGPLPVTGPQPANAAV